VFLTDDGELQANEVMDRSARVMLDELVRWSAALEQPRR
jgi:hypothetical protein